LLRVLRLRWPRLDRAHVREGAARLLADSLVYETEPDTLRAIDRIEEG
jgi:hypothetical protein